MGRATGGTMAGCFAGVICVIACWRSEFCVCGCVSLSLSLSNPSPSVLWPRCVEETPKRGGHNTGAREAEPSLESYE